MDVTSIETLKTVELRKLAGEMGIKGMSSGRKADLIKAINEKRQAEQHADDLAKKLWDDGVKKAKAETEKSYRAELEKQARKRIRTQKCQICGVKKIDAKTQGLDSTMCTDCYDYAGWENTHEDEGHEDPATPDSEREGCPVCVKSLPEPTGQMLIGHAKAARLAAFAEEHNWSVAYATNEADGGDRHVLEIFSASGDVFFEIVWFGRVYQYDLSSYRQYGKKSIKVRNVSAARQIIASGA